MRAELIFTGTELLTGLIQNTHSQYLGLKLSELGIQTCLHITVGDNWSMMEQIIKQSLNRSDLIITTGGLGPTSDDLTRETIAKVFGLQLVPDHNTLLQIKSIFRSRGLNITRSSMRQAYLPEGALILFNTKGTAPGAIIEKQGKTIIMLPGPPHELMAMFERSVIPYLRGKVKVEGTITRQIIFRLTGIAESAVQDLLEDVEFQEGLEIGYMLIPGEIQIRATVRTKDLVLAKNILADAVRKIESRMADYIFACNNEVIEEEAGSLLQSKKLTISTAESCTGGLIAARITDIPGSSNYFKGGVIAYSNDIKIKSLGVCKTILEDFGAVSEKTAKAMAIGVRKIIHSDIGLAVTGIAGPGGILPNKPAGLVFIALAHKEGVYCQEYCFPGSRTAVRQGAANAGLTLLRRCLEQMI